MAVLTDEDNQDDLNANSGADEVYEDPEALAEDENSPEVSEFDLISNPNDFNTLTIVSLIDQGSVVIPRFQRNFVWDRRKASKLIESLLLNLPVPQVFLYEQSKNKFLVIDGQQRLMSIYFFVKGVFPRRHARTLPREFWGQKGGVPSEVLEDKDLFEKFTLLLAPKADGSPNNFAKLEFDTLEDRQQQLQLRTIRVVIIKQARPEGHAAVYEIFNRLNTGGINLTAQEIRMSLNDSPFLDLLVELNSEPRWLDFLGLSAPDLRMKDMELLLRGFAMWSDYADYRAPMNAFLNGFAQRGVAMPQAEREVLKKYFGWFLDWIDDVGRDSLTAGRNKLSAPVFEAFFAGLKRRWMEGMPGPSAREVAILRDAPGFVEATTDKTADRKNVIARVEAVEKLS